MSMCDFITAVLPCGADLRGLAPVVKRHALDFAPLQNDSVGKQLAPGETYHRVTRSMCDCGTALGCLAWPDRPEEPSEHALARKVRKLRTKGWGEGKIERWIAQRAEADVKRARVAKDHEQRLRERQLSDAERWIRVLGDLLDTGKTPSVGLLVHFYSGVLEWEQMKIQKRIVTRIGDARPEFLFRMEHDVLYEFHA
jgi:hypothetical protein